MEKKRVNDTGISEIPEFPFSVWLSQLFHLISPSIRHGSIVSAWEATSWGSKWKEIKPIFLRSSMQYNA